MRSSELLVTTQLLDAINLANVPTIFSLCALMFVTIIPANIIFTCIHLFAPKPYKTKLDSNYIPISKISSMFASSIFHNISSRYLFFAIVSCGWKSFNALVIGCVENSANKHLFNVCIQNQKYLQIKRES